MRRYRPNSKILTFAAAVVAGALALTGAHLAVADPATAAVYTVHLSPDGDDSSDGTSPETAVKTLDRAQDVLAAADPQTDVKVSVAKGTYVAPTTTWTFYVPGHSVTFAPADYESGDGIGDIDSRPVFRGDGSAGYWLSARLPDGHKGGNTNLDFRYLQVEGYSSGGLQLHGGVKVNADDITVPDGNGVDNNTVYGMKFRELGSKHVDSGTGYGAINTWNSSNNLVRNNHFQYIENNASEAGLLHGLYLAHHSNGNEVVGNSFTNVSGGPIRTRNDSNDNEVHGNTFTDTGEHGYSEWFCTDDCVAANPGHARECASHGNAFHDNALESAYNGGSLRTWALTPGGIDTVGGAGCDNEDQPRLRTWDNT